MFLDIQANYITETFVDVFDGAMVEGVMNPIAYLVSTSLPSGAG